MKRTPATLALVVIFAGYAMSCSPGMDESVLSPGSGSGDASPESGGAGGSADASLDTGGAGGSDDAAPLDTGGAGGSADGSPDAGGADGNTDAAADAGGAGGSEDASVVDAVVPDAGGAGGGAGSGPDAAPDVSTDVALDQSAEAEASVSDGPSLEGSLFDVTLPDAALNDSGATVQGCYDCAVVSCNSDMVACDQDAKCAAMLLCLFTDQCWGGPNGVNTSCAFGCALQAGISSPTDPSAAMAQAVGQCISGACQPECGLTADGG